MQMGNALTFQPKDFARLATCRDLELDFAIEGGDLYLGTEGSLGEVDW